MGNESKWVSIWDPVVRLGHWLLVIAFFTAYLTEDDFLTQHVWAGYLVGGIVAFRLVWGFVGTRYARFGEFVRSPAKVVRYVRDMRSRRARRYLGHNPAGGAMILALLVSISGTVYSGLMVHAYENHAGPLAGLVADGAAVNATHRERHADEDAEDFWEEAHEVLANLTLLLIALHIMGVLVSSYLHRENLVRAMVTGKKHPTA